MTTTDAAHSPSYPTLQSAWAPLTALCLTFLVEMLDNTVLTIALPTIGRSLGAGTTDLQWVTGAYSMTFGGLLLVAGRLADRCGRRRVLLIGLTCFGALSALVPLVTTAPQLIGLRALLGVAAAMIAPVSVSLVYRLFDDEALRIRGITIVSTVGLIGFALGPIAAGSVMALLPWQALLVVNAPIAAVAILGVRAGIDPDRPQDLHPHPIDLAGAALSIATLTLSIYVFTCGVERGWTSPATLGVGAAALLALGAFTRRLLTARHPMIDWHLLELGAVRGGAIAQAAVMLAMAGGLFTLTLHLQLVLGWSPLRAAVGMLPVIVTMVGIAPFVDRVVAAVGHRRTVLLGGFSAAVALALLAAGATAPYVVLAAGLVLLTAGIRLVMSTAGVALIGALPETQTSLGTAINDTAQEYGTSIGSAILGTVIAAGAGTALPAAGEAGSESAAAAAWAASFVAAEQRGQLVVAALVAALTWYAGTMLTDAGHHEVSAID